MKRLGVKEGVEVYGGGGGVLGGKGEMFLWEVRVGISLRGGRERKE